jgi:murein DD-endopeptidase MepM/ murein hydrolase activator NlpD
MKFWSVGAAACLAITQVLAFQFPTENRALLDPQGGERFLVGTAGKPWTSGQFGCVRTEGRQLHEGLDIRCLQRDKRGEPTDVVRASAGGTVAYVNVRPGLSNYGNYVVLRHELEGLEVYSLYAHLSAVAPGIKPGVQVRAGQGIATLGRTSNTRQRITQDRAHVHFEIDVRISDTFSAWHAEHRKGQRNDHGEFNGHNLLGVDPAGILKEQARLGTAFSLATYWRSQPETLRVLVRDPRLGWAQRLRGLVLANPATAQGGIAGYEVHLAFNGTPLRLIPRTAAEMPGSAKVRLLSVNEPELKAHPCCRLVVRRGQAWTALPALEDLVQLACH